MGARDIFDAKGEDGESEDPTAGAKQRIHHRLNDAHGLTDERQKRHAMRCGFLAVFWETGDVS